MDNTKQQMASQKTLMTGFQCLFYGGWVGGVERQVAGNCWNEVEPGGWQELGAVWKELRLKLRQELKRNKVN